MPKPSSAKIYGLYDTSIGLLSLSSEKGALTEVLFGNALPAQAIDEKSPVTDRAVEELEEYFAGKRKVFSVPIALKGTPFQKRVWQALLDIAYGQRCSYKDIALKIGSPLAYRAVGMANHNNPISIIVPCHRVVGTNGSLTGYGGGLPLKAMLLNLEQQHVSQQNAAAVHSTLFDADLNQKR